MKKPKVLFIDIETSPILSYTWGLFDQNIALNQIYKDWNILSYAARWQGSTKMIYKDQRNAKNISDDKVLLKEVWKLLDDADIVVGQNSKRFDIKKLNARFIMNGMKPPSSFKQIDTLQIAKKHFAFTSNKLEYTTDKLNTKYKKLKHSKFSGFELWKECLKGNKAAWKEMELYNKWDVLALEELYNKLIPWENNMDFSAYSDTLETVCTCGSTDFVKNGYTYSSVGKYQRYKCSDCGAEARDRKNLLPKDKKARLLVKVNR